MSMSDGRWSNGAFYTGGARTLRTVEELRVGDSACFIYDNEHEYQAVLVPFVRAGIAERQRVLYMYEQRSLDEVRTMLRLGDVDIDRAEADGQVAFLPARQMYARGAGYAFERALDQLHAMTALALADGWSALRVTSEMSWALCQGSERVLEQERHAAAFFRASAALGVTQFERGRASEEVLVNVLLAHPVAVLGSETVHNLYQAPRVEGVTTWVSNAIDRQVAVQGEPTPGKLASGVANDMNNALNAIIAFSDLALQRAGDDEELRADIGEIRVAAGRAADITRRLLAF